jgi:alpha/beta hydrolase fold
MAFITVGDVQMFYEDLGKPDGLPIIMLHGFTGTGRADWIHQIDVLGSSFRLILPDLRGHGRSNNPGRRAAMNHRQFASDVALLCDGPETSWRNGPRLNGGNLLERGLMPIASGPGRRLGKVVRHGVSLPNCALADNATRRLIMCRAWCCKRQWIRRSGC